MERLHDEGSLSPLALQVGTPDDPVAPEERKDVVAELPLLRRLVDLDEVLEAENTLRERAIPEEVVERGQKDRSRRPRRVRVGSGDDEHVADPVLHAPAFEHSLP